MRDVIVTPAASCTREADWRFVLPHPRAGTFEHLVLLGGSPELEATILDLGVARRVSRALGMDGRADAVVVLSGATASVDAVADRLDHDGVLYWEVDRRAPGRRGLTPSRLLRQMRRHGLIPAAAYWVKPGFPQRQMYLPLGAGGAFRWYLNTLYRCTTLRRRILKTGLQALAAHRHGLATFAPCYAMTAVRGTARLPALLERAFMHGPCSGDGMQHVLLANSEAEWSRLVFLLFEPDGAVPTAVIKFPRTAAFNEDIEREHAILRQLDSELGPPLRSSVPQSRLFRWDNLVVSAETCVSGSALSTRSGPAARNALEDVRLVAEWLAAFHCQTTIDRVPAREWITRRLLDGICSEYATLFGLTADEKYLFAALSRTPGTADSDTLPIVWQHGDLRPWNVYLDGKDVSVIDWEIARNGPALADLLYFVTHWTADVAGRVTDPERLKHFESLFFGAKPLDAVGRAAYAAILEYMRRVGVPSCLFTHLLVYTVLEQAVDRARRLDAVDREHTTTRGNNTYVRYLSVLANHADTLFGGARQSG